MADFFDGFAMAARANVHLKVMYGRSNHHKIEACFKAFARALRAACSKDKRLAKMLPSTKGPAVIALVDYGAGNLTSVRKALDAIGAAVWTPAVAGELGRAHGIIVPGVGHFDSTRALTDEWRTAIKTWSRTACRCWGSASACSGCLMAATRLPASKGFGLQRLAFTCVAASPQAQARAR